MAEEEKKASETAPESSQENDEQEEVVVPEKFITLVESIEKLTVLELSELVKILEKKFGVSAQAPVAVAAVGSPGGEGGDEAEGKSSFNVVLSAVGDKKIEVIKAVRDTTGQGLKEAKDMVDAVSSSPQVVKEGAAKEEAEELKKKFEAAGATVELQ